jgi:glutaminyl-tRNA synthetase
LVFNRIVTLKNTWAPAGAHDQEAKRTRKARTPAKVFSPATPHAQGQLTPAQESILQSFVAQGVQEAEARVLAREPQLADFLLQAAQSAPLSTLAHWVVNDLGAALRAGECKITPAGLAGLVRLLEAGEINTRITKDVLAEALQTGQDPVEIVQQRGLRQVSEPRALEPIVERVLSENSDKVAAYRAGKTGLLGFFVGQVMRETQGQADPRRVQELISSKLNRPGQ